MHLLRSVAAVSLIPFSARSQEPAFAQQVRIAGSAQLFLDEDPTGHIKDTLVEAYEALGKINVRFTHHRAIYIALRTPTGLQPFEFYTGYDPGDANNLIAWDTTNHGMSGLGVAFHADGPISGCKAFIQRQCGWALYVAASNPEVGHNKVRVGYLPLHKGARGCYEIWNDMEVWGDQEGYVNTDGTWDHYANPSSISYILGVPDECRQPPGEYKHKGWIHDTDFVGGDIGHAHYSGSDGDAWDHCKAMHGCNGFTINSHTSTVYFKNIFHSHEPTHNPHAKSFVMAQTDYRGAVHTHQMWKIIEGVRLAHHIHQDHNTGNRKAITRQCEEMKGCDAFSCNSVSCWFFDFNHGVAFSSDLAFTTYIAEGNPWSNSALFAANVTMV